MYTVSEHIRVDTFLASQGAFVSRAKAGEAVKEGRVTVNGRVAKKSALVLSPGDVVSVGSSGEVQSDDLLKPTDLKLSILYEDDVCLVIDKPAGISVHPAAGIPKDTPTILHGAAFLFRKRKLPFRQSAVLVHRLDKDTTGCLLLAKNEDAHVILQKQFATRTVEKLYLALVAGSPSPSHAVIDAPIGRHSGDRKKMAVLHAVAHRRDARTTYRTLGKSAHADIALLECTLHTGRTHQIRVHLSSIGHPVLGDPVYERSSSRILSEQWNIPSLCLHAWKLQFHSPDANRSVQVSAPLPDTFRTVILACDIPFPDNPTITVA